MESAIAFDGASQITPPNQFQGTIRSSTCDFSLCYDQGPHCLTSLFQKPKAYNLSNTVDDTLKTKSTGSIFFGDWSSDIPNGTLQLSSEIVPSPEQISSITYCSDGDAYSDSGFVDGRPFFHESRMRVASETPTQNYVQHTHFVDGNLNSTKNGSLSDVFSSLGGGNLDVPSSNLHILQMDSPGILEALDICPSAYRDIPKTPCQGISRPQLKMSGFGKNNFFNMIEDSECLSFSFDECHCSGVSYFSEADSLLFGSTDPSIFVNMNEKTLREDFCSYMNYKRLHVNGSQVSFVQHMHLTVCNERTCNCDRFLLVSHFESCRRRECNICEPVRKLFVSGNSLMKTEIHENSHFVVLEDGELINTEHINSKDGPPPGKRLKTITPIPFDMGISYEVSPLLSQDYISGQKQWLHQWPKTPLNEYLGTSNYGTGLLSPFQFLSGRESTGNDVIKPAEGSGQWSSPVYSEELIAYPKHGDLLFESYGQVENKVTDRIHFSESCHVSLPSEELIVDQQEYETEGMIKSDQGKEDLSIFPSLDADPGIKASDPKIIGVSLIDFFTLEQVQEHLSSLCPSVGQETEGKLVGSVGENTCQLCFMEKLSFASTPVYCSCCGARVKHRLLYYRATDEMGTRHSFCTRCFKASRGGDISFHGISISKQKLQKEINHHVDDESWVQCDKCKAWQHQICALYNDKRDLGGEAEYVCPKCYLAGVAFGDYTPLPGTGAFEAKDLPTTMLSDHIERRLFRRLKEERKERAKALQMHYKEVPGACDLVIRVVLSVSKLLNVKQQFLDIIPEEKYPTEFPFKSKVILLFQKIEGVDVCLFGFYVQEFGSECAPPNQRCVYISYLDSVKYFRPEIKTASGEALRTMVYHEILIGYLDYCKKHGFATCYIWACPPMKGEDYILYCHPVIQKTPKSDKLRYWYKSMLRKAAEEEIAVDCTNLHDHFFVPTGERNSKITVSRLPYFDGDYWSVAAMDMIKRIEHGNGVGSQLEAKKVLTKRTLKSMGHSNIPGDVIKDILVMQKLGQTISPLKEDFIMVRLQYTCTSCYEVILSGARWYCDQCKSIHLCSRCHEKEGSAHTSGSGERHALSQVTVDDVPVDTDDRDVTLDNGYLEYRHSFLSFCQGNHFQFDELRRAKHSSMMVLYHLHNSTVKSIGATCRICDKKTPVKQGWHCVTCPEFNVCNGCYRKQGSVCHVHQLIRHVSLVNRVSENEHAPPHEVLRLRGVKEGLLMHASQCIETKSNKCPYPKCSQIRELWGHAYQCNIRVGGGCQSCLRTWTLLRMHSENCRDSGCRVPRCMDLKKQAEMLALQSDARRSAAVLGSVRAV